VHDQFTVPFGVLDLDPDGALERLRLAHNKSQGVVAKILQGLPGGNDAGVARDDDLGGAVIADHGPDLRKGHGLGWCTTHELLPYVDVGWRGAALRTAAG
jgi:hypothetical protein